MASKGPTSDAMREFGSRVRVRRNEMGVSMERLAEACGIHWSMLGQIERGQRNVGMHNVLKLSAGMGVDPAELVRGLRISIGNTGSEGGKGGRTNPTLFGYLRTSSDAEASRLRSEMVEFARREGYELSAVFADKVRSDRAGLAALLDALRSNGGRNIVVPGLDHIVSDPRLHDGIRWLMERMSNTNLLTLTP